MAYYRWFGTTTENGSSRARRALPEHARSVTAPRSTRRSESHALPAWGQAERAHERRDGQGTAAANSRHVQAMLTLSEASRTTSDPGACWTARTRSVSSMLAAEAKPPARRPSNVSGVNCARRRVSEWRGSPEGLRVARFVGARGPVALSVPRSAVNAESDGARRPGPARLRGPGGAAGMAAGGPMVVRDRPAPLAPHRKRTPRLGSPQASRGELSRELAPDDGAPEVRRASGGGVRGQVLGCLHPSRLRRADLLQARARAGGPARERRRCGACWKRLR